MTNDKYAHFSELSRYEKYQVDYRIHVRHGDSKAAILAPHGGRIERGTMAIAEAMAGEDHSFYCFEGIKPKLEDNKDLHITSTNFDEPMALMVAQDAERVVTIHGAEGREEAIYAGGLDLEFRGYMVEALTKAGFQAGDDPDPNRQGKSIVNLCNRGKSRRGLQLEFTLALRKSMFDLSDPLDFGAPTQKFFRLIEACGKGIDRTLS